MCLIIIIITIIICLVVVVVVVVVVAVVEYLSKPSTSCLPELGPLACALLAASKKVRNCNLGRVFICVFYTNTKQVRRVINICLCRLFVYYLFVPRRSGTAALGGAGSSRFAQTTPSPPTKSFPTKSP